MQELHETRTVRTPDHLWFPHLRPYHDICTPFADVGQLRCQSWIPCHLRRAVVGRTRWAPVEPLSAGFLCLLYGGFWPFVGVLLRRQGAKALWPDDANPDRNRRGKVFASIADSDRDSRRGEALR